MPGAGIGDAPAWWWAAAAVVVVVVGWLVGVPAWCGGGMLSGFWGSAPWLPDPSRVSIFGGFGWVWVGWL